ncbi:hypothetical protein VNO80_33046 [Phaseolus coccineus]|uniref:Uncharacterized protein n=1 Tax=Phaseolus coccineus TaxID=3886 RepID=A0AAN9L1W0_PHACN
MPLPIQPIERERPMLSLVWISRGWSVYLESDTMAGEQRFHPKPGKQAISKPNAKLSPRLKVKKWGSTKRP